MSILCLIVIANGYVSYFYTRHLPLGVGVGVGVDVGQSSSSEPSEQSLLSLHTNECGMHFPDFAHLNSCVAQLSIIYKIFKLFQVIIKNI